MIGLFFPERMNRLFESDYVFFFKDVRRGSMSSKTETDQHLKLRNNFVCVTILVILVSLMVFAANLLAGESSLSINENSALGKKEKQKTANLSDSSKEIGKTLSGQKSKDSEDVKSIIVPDVAPARIFQRNFTIPFNVLNAGSDSSDPAVEIELLYTEDFGKHWLSFGRVSVNARNQEFFFRSQKEGEHWFALRTWYKSGRQTISPAQKLMIRQAPSDLQTTPNFGVSQNSIAPSLSKNTDPNPIKESLSASKPIDSGKLTGNDKSAKKDAPLKANNNSVRPSFGSDRQDPRKSAVTRIDNEKTVPNELNSSKPNSNHAADPAKTDQAAKKTPKSAEPSSTEDQDDLKFQAINLPPLPGGALADKKAGDPDKRSAQTKAPTDQKKTELNAKNVSGSSLASASSETAQITAKSKPQSGSVTDKSTENKKSSLMADDKKKPTLNEDLPADLSLKIPGKNVSDSARSPVVQKKNTDRLLSEKPVPAPGPIPKIDPKNLVKPAPLPKLDPEKIASGGEQIPAPMNKELEKTQAGISGSAGSDNSGSKTPLVLPPLSSRPSSSASEVNSSNDRSKQLMDLANAENKSGSTGTKESVSEEKIFPGKIKNLSIGQTSSGEPTIMIRWFRPEEAGLPDKTPGSLSLERADSPDGPWTLIAGQLNINEKGYWWKASGKDYIPFYLRAVSTDSQGRQSIDAIGQRLELASQLKGKTAAGIDDANKIAAASQTPAPAPSTSNTAPLDKKTAAHESIRAWKNDSDNRNTPFQNAGFEKSDGSSESMVNKTSSVQKNTLNSNYQDLKSYQPSPSPNRNNQQTISPPRPPVNPPTDPNEYSLNPIFTNGFGVLFQSARSQDGNSGERRSIFTSPRTYRNQNAAQNGSQNGYGNNASPYNDPQNVYNNVGYDPNTQYQNQPYQGQPPYPQDQFNGPGGSDPQNPGEVIYLDEKGNRIANPFTSGLTGPNGQQYVPQNGVFVDPQAMQGMQGNNFGGYDQGMPIGMNQDGSMLPDGSMMQSSNGSMNVQNGMYSPDGLPQNSYPPQTGRSYFGSGSANSAMPVDRNQVPNPKEEFPARDYSNPKY